MIPEHHYKSIENLAATALHQIVQNDRLTINPPSPILATTQPVNPTKLQAAKPKLDDDVANGEASRSPVCQLVRNQDGKSGDADGSGNVKLASCHIVPFRVGRRQCDVIFDIDTGNAIVIFSSFQRVSDLIGRLGEESAARALLDVKDEYLPSFGRAVLRARFDRGGKRFVVFKAVGSGRAWNELHKRVVPPAGYRIVIEEPTEHAVTDFRVSHVG